MSFKTAVRNCNLLLKISSYQIKTCIGTCIIENKYFCAFISSVLKKLYFITNSQLTEYQEISISPSKKKKPVSVFIACWGQKYSYHSGWKNNFMESLGNPVSELKCNLNSSENKKCFYRRSALEIWLRKKEIMCSDSIKLQWGAAVNALLHSSSATVNCVQTVTLIYVSWAKFMGIDI